MSRTKLSLALISLVIISSVFAFCYFRKPYLIRELKGNVTLNQEWLELIPDEPLEIKRDTQELVLFPASPIKMVLSDKGKGLIPAEEPAVSFEAELLDSRNVVHHPKSTESFTMTGDLFLSTNRISFKDLPKNVVIQKLLVKSSSPFPVKKIIWSCYNWSEVNHQTKSSHKGSFMGRFCLEILRKICSVK